MNTCWQFSIHVGDRCVCSNSAKGLAEAIQLAFRDAIYYQAIYPDTVISIRDMREQCVGCGNTGLMSRQMRWKVRLVKCTECGGNYPTTHIEKIDLKLPDAANKIRIVQEQRPIE